MDVRTAKCLLLTKVLVADGMMSDVERDFLEAAMEKLRIPLEERKRIVDLEGWDEAEAALAALSDEEKQAIVSELVDAASADGRLSSLEAAMVKKISVALGVE